MTNPVLRLLFLAALATASPASAASADEAQLRSLNEQYLKAFVSSDAAVYRSLLADDFHAVLADGRLLDKGQFLAEAAQPSGAADLHLLEVAVRVYGEAAVVSGTVGYDRLGQPARTRYVDLYVKRDGRWQAVSAQSTRVSPQDPGRKP